MCSSRPPSWHRRETDLVERATHAHALCSNHDPSLHRAHPFNPTSCYTWKFVRYCLTQHARSSVDGNRGRPVKLELARCALLTRSPRLAGTYRTPSLIRPGSIYRDRKRTAQFAQGKTSAAWYEEAGISLIANNLSVAKVRGSLLPWVEW